MCVYGYIFLEYMSYLYLFYNTVRGGGVNQRGRHTSTDNKEYNYVR